MADDQAAQGGRNDEVDAFGADQRPQRTRQHPAERFGVPRVGKDQGGLKIGRAVETTAEFEMSAQIRACLEIEIENLTVSRHSALYSVTFRAACRMVVENFRTMQSCGSHASRRSSTAGPKPRPTGNAQESGQH